MSEKILNVAIIGQGRSGRNIHGKFFQTNPPGYRVVAIVDAIEERRERALTEYEGIRVFADYRELFAIKDEIDLVVNATFSHMHYPVSLDLLNHGFNVLVEKPMAATKEQCQEMIDAAKQNNVMLAVFQQSRLAPYYRRIKEVLASGILGEIHEISIRYSSFGRRYDWQTALECNGGNSYNTGPHPIDQALDLWGFDEEDPEIFAWSRNVTSAGDAEDCVKIIFAGKNKPLIDIEINSADTFRFYSYKINGKYGSLLLPDFGSMKLKYYNPQEHPMHDLVLSPLSGEDGTPAYCSETIQWIEKEEQMDSNGSFNAAVSDYYQMIYDHLVYGKEREIVPEQSMKQIALLEKIRKQYIAGKF